MMKKASTTIMHGAWTAAAAALFLAGGLFLSGCRSGTVETGDRPSSTQVENAQYTCPMHPEVVSDRPGKCPVCGMNLEKKMPDGMQHGSGHEGHGHE